MNLFRYFGPIDGHNVSHLCQVLNELKNIPGPKILHCITEKGKGYNPYERQIYFLESRMSNNNRFPSEILWQEWVDLKSNSKTQNNSNWVPLGPFDVPLILSNNKKKR